MNDARPALTHRAPCRGCGTVTAGAFVGWVTVDAAENSIRPRAFYRACMGCGLQRMVLGGDREITDVEGFARTLLDEIMIPLGGRATGTRAPDGPGRTDWEAALWFLVDRIWRLYAEQWDPTRGMTFKSYASGLGRKKLIGYLSDESGEPNGRSGGRVHPKAHASSVSVSLDALLEFGYEDIGDGRERDDERHGPLDERKNDHGRLEVAHAAGARDFADDRSPDLAWALATRDRD